MSGCTPRIGANQALCTGDNVTLYIAVVKHGLIKDISVSEGDNEKSLEVTIIPAYTSVTFGTLGISLNRADSEKGWRRKKKDVFGQVKGLRPEAAPRVIEYRVSIIFVMVNDLPKPAVSWRPGGRHIFFRAE